MADSLDALVATAMGWSRDGCRSYSTDPATQAEMLAWLDKGGSYNVDIKCNCPYQTYAGHPRRIFAELTNCTAPHVIVNVANGAGMTINEALARLVVAVAAREGQP